MASSSSSPNSTLFLIAITLLVLCSTTIVKASNGLILTLVNNCPFPVWPAIQSNAGLPVLERGGFSLSTLAYRSFPAPAQPWSGRIWARTGCSNSNNHFSCVTGDCGRGTVECDGAGGATPATLAQFSLHHGPTDMSTYSVSLVDGFNVPLTVTPHEGIGVCPVVGCKADLLATCPASLQFRCPPGGGAVVGCKSGCGAFGTDDLCCRNSFAGPQGCKPSGYSQFFKNDCPATFTYPQDTPSLIPQCSSPRELKVIFCH